MGITAQRRWRERAAGPRPAAAPPPAFVSQTEHQLSLQELTKSYEAKLAELQAASDGGRYTVTLDVDSEEFRATVAPLVAELEKAEAAAVELQTKLDEALAKVAELEGVNKSLAEMLEAKTQGATDAPAPEPQGEPTAAPPEAPAPEAEKPAEDPDATKPAAKGGKPKPR